MKRGLRLKRMMAIPAFVALSLLLAIAENAFAGFIMLDDDVGSIVKQAAPKSKSNDKAKARIISRNGIRTVIINKGRKPSVIPLAQNHVAAGSMLEDALGAIVPPDFKIYAADGVDLAVPVKARSGGGSWVSIITGLLAPTPLTATIDWDSKEISIAPDAGSVGVATAAEEPAKERWEVKKQDGLLSAAVARWCKQAGGACVVTKWEATHDFPIEAEAVFAGNFEDALKWLMNSVGGSSGHTFKYTLHANNVLIVNDEERRKWR